MLKCIMRTCLIIKIPVKCSAVYVYADKSTQRKRGRGQEKPGSRPRVGARFEFTVLLMTLLPYSVLEKKL